MRLFLLPISTRRTLLYCERVQLGEGTMLNKLTSKASETWASWEKADGGWKKSLTVYGNAVLKRIPYQEWGLKTIPPLSQKRKLAELRGDKKMEVLFPGLFLKEQRAPQVLKALATERQSLHRKRLIWSIIGMPITAPFALVPIVPNIPFFYLVFRAYSHWKALSGSKHLAFLLEKELLKYCPSSALDEVYAAGLMYPTREVSRNSPIPTQEQIEKVSDIVEGQTNKDTEDVMMLQRWNGKLLAERFRLPEMEVEIERAVEQVENAIKEKEELLEEKREIERATAPPSGNRPGNDKKE